MNKTKLLKILEITLELPPQTLTGSETLRHMQAWDSMSTLRFIAMADKEFGLPLPASHVLRCQTVDDLVALIGNARAAA